MAALLLTALLPVLGGPLASKPPRPGPILWTFDDGPHRRSVPHLLRLLRQHGITRSVWFVLGSQLQHPGNRLAMKAVLAAGHLVANHLWSHRSPCKLGARGVLRELRRTRRLLRRHAPASQRLRWYRPPFGATCYSRTVGRQGYRVVMWHVADIGSSAATMARRIMYRSVRGLPTTVLVHHDWRKLRALLALLQASGCVGGTP